MSNSNSRNSTPIQVIRSFYSALLLKTVICPSQRGSRPQKTKFPGWRRFLRDLCHFCDEEGRGKTVTSIAVAKAEHGFVFMIGSNEESTDGHSPNGKKARKHLNWVLQFVTKRGVNTKFNSTDLEQELLDNAVRIGRKRMKIYLGDLKKALQSVTGMDEIRSLLEEKDFAQLSKKSDHLRQQGHIMLLRTYAKQKGPQYAALREVSHLVGRLASWARSAHFLAKIAGYEGFVRVLKRYEVQVVPLVQGVGVNPLRSSRVPTKKVPGNPPDLNVLIRRYEGVFRAIPTPQNRELSLERFASIIEPVDKTKVAQEKLDDCDSVNFQPRIHSELLVLQYMERREFAFGDKYVACSKGPCYCCDEYVRRRYPHIQMRATHGNSYPKWSPPYDTNLSKRASGAGVNEILENMTRSMVIRINEQLCRGPQDRLWNPDSTTGIDDTVTGLTLEAEGLLEYASIQGEG